MALVADLQEIAPVVCKNGKGAWRRHRQLPPRESEDGKSIKYAMSIPDLAKCLRIICEVHPEYPPEHIDVLLEHQLRDWLTMPKLDEQ